MSDMNIVIHQCEAPETGYWAEIPGLPGCVSEGETIEEVRRNIVEAAIGCFEASLRWKAQHTSPNAKSECAPIRSGLDPMYYSDIESFRAAVADGSIDVTKGCQNMDEYFRSVSHG